MSVRETFAHTRKVIFSDIAFGITILGAQKPGDDGARILFVVVEDLNIRMINFRRLYYLALLRRTWPYLCTSPGAFVS